MYSRNEGERDIFKWDFNTKNHSPQLFYKGDMSLYATHVFPDTSRRAKMYVLENDFPGYVANKVGIGALHQISTVDS